MEKNFLWEAVYAEKREKRPGARAARAGAPGPFGRQKARVRRADWGALEIEIIAGREESLLLARPASGVYLSREALSRLAAHGR